MPMRLGDGTSAGFSGISEVRLGDGTILHSGDVVPPDVISVPTAETTMIAIEPRVLGHIEIMSPVASVGQDALTPGIESDISADIIAPVAGSSTAATTPTIDAVQSTIVLEDFESYASNTELFTTYDAGGDEDGFSITTTGEIEGAQSLVDADTNDSMFSTSASHETPRENVYRCAMELSATTTSPWFLVQCQGNEPVNTHGCYAFRWDAEDGRINISVRPAGEVEHATYTNWSSGTVYIGEIELWDNGVNTSIKGRLLDSNENVLTATAEIQTDTEYTGGTIGFRSSGTSTGNLWDSVTKAARQVEELPGGLIDDFEAYASTAELQGAWQGSAAHNSLETSNPINGSQSMSLGSDNAEFALPATQGGSTPPGDTYSWLFVNHSISSDPWFFVQVQDIDNVLSGGSYYVRLDGGDNDLKLGHFDSSPVTDAVSVDAGQVYKVELEYWQENNSDHLQARAYEWPSLTLLAETPIFEPGTNEESNGVIGVRAGDDADIVDDVAAGTVVDILMQPSEATSSTSAIVPTASGAVDYTASVPVSIASINSHAPSIAAADSITGTATISGVEQSGVTVRVLRTDTSPPDMEAVETTDASGNYTATVPGTGTYHASASYDDGAGTQYNALSEGFLETGDIVDFALEEYTTPALDAVDFTIQPTLPPGANEVRPPTASSTIGTSSPTITGTVTKATIEPTPAGLTTALSDPSISTAAGNLGWAWEDTFTDTSWLTDADAAETLNVETVTNLDASGTGSLDDAINNATSYPTVVVFEVGGVIDLAGSNITATASGGVWVAGETAPDPGISIIRGTFRVETNDVILSHIGVYSGDDVGSERDSITVDQITGTANLIFDHCTAMWGTDEVIGLSDPVDQSSFINCIIAEGLFDSIHPEGTHSRGLLFNNTCVDVVVAGNLYAHNNRRHPLNRADAFIVNQYIYNWGGGCIHMDQEHPTMSSIGHYCEDGPNTSSSSDRAIHRFDADLYWDDIHLDGIARDITDGSQTILSDPVNVPPTVTISEDLMPAVDVKAWAMEHAGMRPASRPSVDANFINNRVGDGNGSRIDSQTEVGGYPAYSMTTRSLSVPSSEIVDWIKTNHTIPVENTS